jgi:hypothetical protein
MYERLIKYGVEITMLVSRDKRIIFCGKNHTYLILLVLMATLVACVLAESNNEDGLLPAKIVFKEASHDFGDIAEGVQVEHVFKFSNSGEDTLRVSRVQGG